MDIHRRKKRSSGKAAGSRVEEDDVLLPGLPCHLSELCLAGVQPRLLFSVCHPWRRLLYSPKFPGPFSLYVFLSSGDPETPSIEFFTLDPLSSTWKALPPPPSDPPLHLIHRHPSFISRNLSIQALAVCDHLVLVAGTTQKFYPALSQPLVFHPETAEWFYGPPFHTPRRWCAAGALGNTVYLASGYGAKYSPTVARSMEQWRLTPKRKHWKWEELTGLSDGRFSREAVEGVGWRGKLYMVNVKGSGTKEGVIYDPKNDRWEVMSEGMLAGWNGPAAAMDEEVMYVVDERRGVLMEYIAEADYWMDLIQVPELVQAEQIAAGRGRVCVVSGTGERIIVMDVQTRPPRVWMEELPFGQQFLGVHILPNMRV